MLRLFTFVIADAVLLITPVPVKLNHVPFVEGLLEFNVHVVEHKCWSGPATATGKGVSAYTCKVEVEEGQTPLEIVHTNSFAPAFKFETNELLFAGEFTTDVPVNTDQMPVPTEGMFALILQVEVQTVKLLPAFELSGSASRITSTVAFATGQIPLVTVHKNVFVPVPKAVTPDEGFDKDVTEPVPEISDHWPVPEVGVVAFKVALPAQIFWLLPALAVGAIFFIIVTVDVALGQTPLVTVHTNELVPVLKPVTADAGFVLVITLDVPVITDQTPEPIVGLTAARVAPEAQTVWLLPAFETGIASLMMFTVEVATGQTPLVTVHKNVFVPVAIEFTAEEGLPDATIVAVPLCNDQLPVPTVGVIAPSVAFAEQIFWLLPALAIGEIFLIILTVDVALGQTPLVTVHIYELVPVLKPVTAEDGFVLLVTLDVPAITDQLPEPIVGLTAARVAPEAQTV